MRTLTFLSRLLLALTVAEFLLLRVLSRLGAILPEDTLVTWLLTWVGYLGVWSLNAAVITGAALLVLLVVTLFIDKSNVIVWPVKLAACLVLTLSMVGLVGPYWLEGFWGPSFLFTLSAASLVAVAIIGAVALRLKAMERLSLVIVSMTYAAGFYHYMSRAGGALEISIPAGGELLMLAEGLILLIAPALLLTFRPAWNAQAVAVSSVVALLYGGLATKQPWIASALAIWDFAVTSFLPVYVYALALWFLVYTVLSLHALAENRGIWPGTGLALLALGGLRLDYAYFSLLVGVGILLLATALLGSNPGRAANRHRAESLFQISTAIFHEPSA